MKAIALSTGDTVRLIDLPGEGRPLLMLHGLGCAATSDFPAVARAAGLARRRVLMPDLLGFGYSDRPAGFGYTIADHARVAAELLERLDIGLFDLYGHSMGGSVAIELAALCTARVLHLVLSEPNLDAGGGLFSRAIAAQAEADYVRTGHARDVRRAADSGSAVWAGTLRAADALAVHRGAAALVAGGQPGWRRTLLALPMPRTLIFGERSLPDADHEALPAHRVAVRVVPQAGHSMAWENPLALGEAIAASCA